MRREWHEAVKSARTLPGEAVLVLLTVPILISTFWYFGRSGFYLQSIARFVPPEWPLARLYPFFYFSLSAFVLRMPVPMAMARLAVRRPWIGRAHVRTPGQVR